MNRRDSRPTGVPSAIAASVSLTGELTNLRDRVAELEAEIARERERCALLVEQNPFDWKTSMSLIRSGAKPR